MSDSDTDSNSSAEEEAGREGACGKLLEEIAEQDQVAEVDPIDVLLDKLYSYVDLDLSLVEDEERQKMYKLLEELALKQESVVMMFECVDNKLTHITVDTDSDQPKTILMKPISGPIKVNFLFIIP